MKNKRYKRIAKRIKGACLTKDAMCSRCKYIELCFKKIGICYHPYDTGIRTLENLIKNN